MHNFNNFSEILIEVLRNSKKNKNNSKFYHYLIFFISLIIISWKVLITNCHELNRYVYV